MTQGGVDVNEPSFVLFLGKSSPIWRASLFPRNKEIYALICRVVLREREREENVPGLSKCVWGAPLFFCSLFVLIEWMFYGRFLYFFRLLLLISFSFFLFPFLFFLQSWCSPHWTWVQHSPDAPLSCLASQCSRVQCRYSTEGRWPKGQQVTVAIVDEMVPPSLIRPSLLLCLGKKDRDPSPPSSHCPCAHELYCYFYFKISVEWIHPNRGKQRAVGSKKTFPGIPCWKIRFEQKGWRRGTRTDCHKLFVCVVCGVWCVCVCVFLNGWVIRGLSPLPFFSFLLVFSRELDNEMRERISFTRVVKEKEKIKGEEDREGGVNWRGKRWWKVAESKGKNVLLSVFCLLWMLILVHCRNQGLKAFFFSSMTNACLLFFFVVIEVVDGAVVHEKREVDNSRLSMTGTFPIVHGPHHHHPWCRTHNTLHKATKKKKEKERCNREYMRDDTEHQNRKKWSQCTLLPSPRIKNKLSIELKVRVAGPFLYCFCLQASGSSTPSTFSSYF